ncbi:MAG: polyphosphate kinase 2 family protein [Bacteroidota bacterium]|nr:polyphosphate kinase 2 family protein [Bacteroidota bacterium]
MNIKNFIPDSEGKGNFKLSKIKTGDTSSFKSKEETLPLLEKNIEKLNELQAKLYAESRYGAIILIQAMDTAGKDGIIKHVMSGLNPQGTTVFSFKQPSTLELRHDYLWRANLHLPERGQIGIFNRSYYEEILVVKVHNLIQNQNLPDKLITEDIWNDRYRQINDFEKYLHENGFTLIKLFLHISKEEQKQRLLARIDDKSKNWKFSEADLSERAYWDTYMECYEKLLENTNTGHNPWYVIPADKKWFARLAVSEIIVKHLDKLDLAYPQLDEKHKAALEICRKRLIEE